MYNKLLGNSNESTLQSQGVSGDVTNRVLHSAASESNERSTSERSHIEQVVSVGDDYQVIDDNYEVPTLPSPREVLVEHNTTPSSYVVTFMKLVLTVLFFIYSLFTACMNVSLTVWIFLACFQLVLILYSISQYHNRSNHRSCLLE